MSEMQERVSDYLGMGVAMVWIVDPWRRKAFVADMAGMREAIAELTVPETAILVRLSDAFAELDELEARLG